MILKTGVLEPSLPKSGSPTTQKNITSFKNRSPSTRNEIQDCKSAVSERSDDDTKKTAHDSQTVRAKVAILTPSHNHTRRDLLKGWRIFV